MSRRSLNTLFELVTSALAASMGAALVVTKIADITDPRVAVPVVIGVFAFTIGISVAVWRYRSHNHDRHAE